ncbi:MAG: glycosyltransferase [Syntrophaceae bacterium]
MPDNVWAIVVAFNDSEGLKQCIVALNEQSPAVEKIVIIDNNASYCVKDIVDSVVCSKQSSVSVIATSRNLGSAGGFSLGMEQAFAHGAEWIWLHDEDDYPEKDCLGKLLCRSNGMIRVPQIIDPKTGNILHYFKRIQGRLGHFHPAPPYRVDVDVAGTAGLFINREAIARIGVYDPDFFVGYEDYEYCLRAKAAGLPIHVVTEAVVFHPDHQSPTFSGYSHLDHIRAYLPSFWGIIRKGSPRDAYATRNYIIVSKRYKPLPIICLEMLLSLCILPFLKIVDQRIRLCTTLKTYLKTLCVG